MKDIKTYIAEDLEPNQHFKVGDILVYCHTYNACYPQFVRITKMTAKTVWVESIGKIWQSHDGYGQNGFRMPDLDSKPTPVKGSFRIKQMRFGKENKEYITIHGCMAVLWDGEPVEEYTD